MSLLDGFLGYDLSFIDKIHWACWSVAAYGEKGKGGTNIVLAS